MQLLTHGIVVTACYCLGAVLYVIFHYSMRIKRALYTFYMYGTVRKLCDSVSVDCVVLVAV